MDEEIVPPAKKTLEAQLNSVRFLSGGEAGRWELLLLKWPLVYVRVKGCDPDTERTFTHDFRLECTGFPDPGPLVERWVYANDSSNGRQPSAPAYPASPGFLDAMKDWSPGRGVYRAWSRDAAAHND